MMIISMFSCSSTEYNSYNDFFPKGIMENSAKHSIMEVSIIKKNNTLILQVALLLVREK